MGEGGESFYIAQSARCPDLLVMGGISVLSRDSGGASMPAAATYITFGVVH
jgi:hypothetical protein